MTKFNKRISIEFIDNKITLWKLNKKGFYNFISYLDKETTLSQIQKKYKGYDIIDETGMYIK